jgi:hypothetical protein
MLALGGASDVDWYVVDIVGVVFGDETGIHAGVVRSGAPVIRVLSSAVCATVVLEVFIGFIVHGVVGGFWGLIRGPVLFQVNTQEVWFVISQCRVAMIVSVFEVIVPIVWVFVFIELIDVVKGVVIVTPIVWVVVVVVV